MEGVTYLYAPFSWQLLEMLFPHFKQKIRIHYTYFQFYTDGNFQHFFINLITWKAAEINTTIIDGYIELLDNLSSGNKLYLISKLTASVKTDLNSKKSSLKKAFGAFDTKKSAEEIIKEIRNSRVLTRQTEAF